MSDRWKGLLIGLLLGVAVAGLAVGVWWWWPRKPTYTPGEWLQRIADGAGAAEELAGMGDFGLEVLLEARESDDIRVHRRAARALVSFGEKAVPPLVKALPRARGRAEVILVAIGEPAIPALEEALAKEGPAPSAARVLGMMGERAQAARPALMGVVQDTKRDHETRAAAAWALGQLGPDPAAAVVLASAARSGVRDEAVRALELMGGKARPAARALAEALDDGDDQLALQTLGRIGGPEARRALLALAISNPDSGAIEALALIGPPTQEEVGELLAVLRHPAGRRSFVRSLGPLLVPQLVERLERPGSAVEMAEVLGQLGPAATSARPALEAALGSKDRRLVLAAARALLAISPDDHEKPAAALLRLLAPEEAERELVLRVLAGLGQDAPLGATAACLLASGPAWQVPLEAALALGEVSRPSPAVVEALRREIKRGPLAGACFRAAEKAGPALKRLAPEVTAALRRGEPFERLQAAMALASIAPDRAGPAVPLLREGYRGGAAAEVAFFLAESGRPPEALLEFIRDELKTAGGREPLFALKALEGYPREELLALVPDIHPQLEGSAEVARRAARLLVFIGPDALPFLAGKKLPAAAVVLADPRMKLPDGELNALAKRTEDGDPVVRQAAGAILAAQGARTPASRAAARAMLDHIEPEMRASGAKALVGTGEHKEALRECLFDPSAAVRASAARALAGEFDALRPALRDGDPQVRLEAARCLLASGDDREQAVRELVRLGRAASPAGRAAVAEAIHEGASELVPLLEADSRTGHLPAAAWLVRHSPAKSKAAMVRLLCGLTRQGRREEAARLLGGLGARARAALPWLRRQLRPGLTQAEREAVREAIQLIDAGK